MFAPSRGFWGLGHSILSARNAHNTVVGLLNDVRQILPRPTLVAMATKFETKTTITRLVY